MRARLVSALFDFPAYGGTTMRMMLRFTLRVERGNAVIRDGAIERTLESIMTKLKAEAAYFAPPDGKRARMIFFDC
jgi:hypothetical protein